MLKVLSVGVGRAETGRKGGNDEEKCAHLLLLGAPLAAVSAGAREVASAGPNIRSLRWARNRCSRTLEDVLLHPGWAGEREKAPGRDADGLGLEVFEC